MLSTNVVVSSKLIEALDGCTVVRYKFVSDDDAGAGACTNVGLDGGVHANLDGVERI